MIVGAIVIVGYTVMGGFMAVSTTDLIQSIVMTISLIVIVFYGIHMAGGWDEVVSNATSLAGYLSMNHIHDRATGTAAPYSLLTIVSTLAWGLGYFGMPHILLRFMAIEDEKKLTHFPPDCNRMGADFHVRGYLNRYHWLRSFRSWSDPAFQPEF